MVISSYHNFIKFKNDIHHTITHIHINNNTIHLVNLAVKNDCTPFNCLSKQLDDQIHLSPFFSHSSLQLKFYSQNQGYIQFH